VTGPTGPTPATGPTGTRGTDAYRAAAGQFVTGIAVVAVTTGGVTHAMTVNAFTSVSLDPLLILVGVDRAARSHDAVVGAGTWAVSVLTEDHEKTARWLATRGPPGDGQLDGHPHHPGPVTGHPILDGALAALECRTYATHPGGDHTILVGQVLSVAAPVPGADLPGPLLYYAGRYRRLPAR
jgi:flavin reductase